MGETSGCPQDELPLSTLDSLFECAYMVDRQRRILFWNNAAEGLTGYPVSSVRGSRCCDNILVHLDENGVQLCTGCCPLERTMSTGQSGFSTVFLQHRLGHRIKATVRTVPILEGGEVVGGLELFQEASDTMALRSRMQDLEKLALLDALTGAGNRRLASILLDSRQSALERFDWGYGLAMMDLDGLKAINDGFGHKVGDATLRAVAASMMSVLRPSDSLCRWGGDEFLLLVERASLRDLETVCERMRAIVESTSISSGSGRLSITISAGATAALKGESPAEALARADVLLYEAKKAGRNKIITG